MAREPGQPPDVLMIDLLFVSVSVLSLCHRWRPAPAVATGAGRTGYWKEMLSMVTVLLPPYQKPMASCDGELRLMPLAAIGIRMSW